MSSAFGSPQTSQDSVHGNNPKWNGNIKTLREMLCLKQGSSLHVNDEAICFLKIVGGTTFLHNFIFLSQLAVCFIKKVGGNDFLHNFMKSGGIISILNIFVSASSQLY